VILDLIVSTVDVFVAALGVLGTSVRIFAAALGVLVTAVDNLVTPVGVLAPPVGNLVTPVGVLAPLVDVDVWLRRNGMYFITHDGTMRSKSFALGFDGFSSAIC